MLSYNSSQSRINPSYCSSDGMSGANAAHSESYLDSQQMFQGNNNASYNLNNNSKPVSKLSAPSHGKHISLHDKNTGATSQNPICLRLPSLGQLSSTKALGINPLSPNDCASLLDTENRFLNSCSSAQQKKRMIRVQSKNKFPSDFFNENCEQTTPALQSIDESHQSQYNTQFFQFSDKNLKINPSTDYRLSNPNIVNHLKLSNHSVSNQDSIHQYETYTQDYNLNNNLVISPKPMMDDMMREFSQIQSPQNTQYVQRPFISAIGTRSAKSPPQFPQQFNTPLNQIKREFQFSKNNFIEQQYEMTMNANQQSSNQAQAAKNLGQKQLNNRTNLSSSGSVKRLISAQFPSAAVSPGNTFRMLSPTEKPSRILSPSSSTQQQKIQSRLIFKANSSIQPSNSDLDKEESSVQKVTPREITSCANGLSIPNSPKNVPSSQPSINYDGGKKLQNKNNLSISTKQELNTPKSLQNQKNLQHPPMSQQAQRPKGGSIVNNHKRTPNYDVKSNANLHEAISKGSFSCKNGALEKKDKIPKEKKEAENSENHETASNKFISRKPVAVNKSKGGNIDFTNFKIPLSTMNRKIKEISGIPQEKQERTSGKSATVIIPASNKKQESAKNTVEGSQTPSNTSTTPMVATSSQNNSDSQKKRNYRTLSQTSQKLQSFIVVPEQTPKSLAEVQIEEQIEDQHSFNAEQEHAKEEQTFEGENSDTTKNSIQQNNTISLNSPSIQHENLYLFSDKQIQSTQNSMLALPPPQLKQFYSDCGETSNFNYQNTFSIPNQNNICGNDANTFNFDHSRNPNGSVQSFSQNNSQYNNKQQCNQVAEFIQEDDQYTEESGAQNNYNRTANFTPYNNNNAQCENSNQGSKLKSSQKSQPKLALNSKECEKYKPFLIRKVSSQSSMRVKGSIANYSSNSSSSSHSNNIVFDFNKNGSASTTANGKSLLSTPTLMASNEYVNSHEFSFSNQ